MKKQDANKGNYSLDTDERIQNYNKLRALGWEKEYKEYRQKWNRGYVDKIVPEYPLNIDLEISAKCNLKCPMCFLQTDDFNKNRNRQSFMEEKLFKKVVDEMSDNNIPALRIFFRGEPTLHPKFLEFIKYAKEEKNIKEISMTTNGALLTNDLIEKMIPYLDWITISIDGLKDVYEKIRKPIKFDKIVDVVRNIKKIKEKLNRKRPVIVVQSVSHAIEENAEEYYNIFSPYCDLVTYCTYLDFNEKNWGKYQYEENITCPQIYQRLIVLVDGKCVLCCMDSSEEFIVGDVTKNSIFDIWHGSILTDIRNNFDINNYHICNSCLIPKKLKSKKISINNREINMINGCLLQE